mgnify:CR=1 FL=1|tara:strand:+ start:171 stop:1013 length:843 start_codon:yes stop_codon:yes gene_type:complete
MFANRKNVDQATIDSFGDEWSRHDQSQLSEDEVIRYFNFYFSIFPWNLININSEGFDMGCGSGRWAKVIAPKVRKLNCIEPSKAIEVAKRNLANNSNICFHNGTVEDPGIEDSSQDFGYSLGVLHHIPNTEKAIKSCVKLLKPKAPFLIYLYYSFDNRPFFYKLLWKLSNYVRYFISRQSPTTKHIICDLIAFSIYLPLAKTSYLLELINIDVSNIPLNFYRRSSLYTMRTDVRDRFGTPLEQRFSKKQIQKMCINSGLENIKFSNIEPYWCVVGTKKSI